MNSLFTYLLILAFWSGQWSLTIVWNATLVYSAWKIYLNMLALIPNHLSMTLRAIFLFRKNLTVEWEDNVVHLEVSALAQFCEHSLAFLDEIFLEVDQCESDLLTVT